MFSDDGVLWPFFFLCISDSLAGIGTRQVRSGTKAVF
jgi:hypothetical protein